MSSDWLQNTESQDRVVSLLEFSGVPLELQVAAVCDKFCSSFSRQDISVISGQRIYSISTSHNELREIDQNVRFRISHSTNMSRLDFSANVVIECKYRKNVELFAFSTEQSYINTRFPIYTMALKYLPIFEDLVHSHGKYSFGGVFDIPKSNLALLKIDGGRTPIGVHEENVVYNAAGALYDFISFDLLQDDPVLKALRDKASECIDELGLLLPEKELRDWYFSKGESGAAEKWIRKLVSPTIVATFNERLRNRLTKFDAMVLTAEMIKLYVPVICVNGPIYSVAWNSDPQNIRFSEVPYVLTSIRKLGWPDISLRAGLSYVQPEVPVIVTNLNNLSQVLDAVSTWLQEVSEPLHEIVHERQEFFPIETHLCRKIIPIVHEYKEHTNLWHS